MRNFLLFAALVLLGYWIFKRYLSGGSKQDVESSTPDAELIQDPQCGSYFLKQRGVKGVVEGRVMHFCSEECYDKYQKRHRDE